MSVVTITIDGREISAEAGTVILDAARQAGIYIPHLCSHPDLAPLPELRPAEAVYRGALRIENSKLEAIFEGCRLCVVEIEGQEVPRRACNTPISEGLAVLTATPELEEYRQDRLAEILATHPHACLTCSQREGCARFPCSMNVPEEERCCFKFGNCELQRLAEYVGIRPETPRYIYRELPVVTDEPLFERDYNLCINCNRCVRICREVRNIGALDFVNDKEGRAVVGSAGSNPRESGCKFCTACVHICPTGALYDKREFTGAPCRAACPAGIDAARYVRLVGEGKYAEAAAVIREKVPFPLVLGYVCHHPCETVCRRGEIDEPIAIRALKRHAAENDDGSWKTRRVKRPASGKKAAVVGSGPAGLTAAYYLAGKAHAVTVFESAPEPGGLLRYGIPAFRLPREVIDNEIAQISEMGVEIITDSPVADPSVLFRQGYDAVLLATGAGRSVKLGIGGEDAPGVLAALVFLRRVNSGEVVEVGAKAVIVGGGNAAIDAARAARRLGAEVTVIYRRSRDEMPAAPEEIEAAEAEGVAIQYQALPVIVLVEGGKVGGVRCVRTELGGPDESGRRSPMPVAGSEFEIKADILITAFGQENDDTALRAKAEGVFAGGDAVSGPSSVVEAIAGGRAAASEIDRYLGGDGDIEEELSPEKDNPPWMGREEDFLDRSRVPLAVVSSGDSLLSEGVTEPPLSNEQARYEGCRCLRCDLRFTISEPVLPHPPRSWVGFTLEHVAQAPDEEGVFTLYDGREEIIYIKGTVDLRKELAEQLEMKENARYFSYEIDPFYTRRESQLLQQYVARHGQMPEGNRELDDLF